MKLTTRLEILMLTCRIYVTGIYVEGVLHYAPTWKKAKFAATAEVARRLLLRATS